MILAYSVFDSVKNLAIGEGGGLSAKDPERIKSGKNMRYCGIGKSGFLRAKENAQNRWWEYDIGKPFIKMLPTDLEASIGLVQLAKLKKNQARRKQIWEIYQEAFKELSWITCPRDAEDYERHSYFTYFIQTARRDELATFLLKNEVYTTLRYHPLHLNKIFHCTHRLPNAEQLNKTGLNIPLHPRLTDDEVNYVIDKIKSFG